MIFCQIRTDKFTYLNTPAKFLLYYFYEKDLDCDEGHEA